MRFEMTKNTNIHEGDEYYAIVRDSEYNYGGVYKVIVERILWNTMEVLLKGTELTNPVRADVSQMRNYVFEDKEKAKEKAKEICVTEEGLDVYPYGHNVKLVRKKDKFYWYNPWNNYWEFYYENKLLLTLDSDIDMYCSKNKEYKARINFNGVTDRIFTEMNLETAKEHAVNLYMERVNSKLCSLQEEINALQKETNDLGWFLKSENK